MQAAAKTGLRVFEPLLGQWQLEPTQSADGVLPSTKVLLDAGIAAQPEAVFILRIHMAPMNVSHMCAWAEGGRPLKDLGPGRPTPADPAWVPQATEGLIPFLLKLDSMYPGKIAGISVEYPSSFLGGCVAGGISSPGHCKAAFKTLAEAQAACASTRYPTCRGVTTRGLPSQVNFSVELRSSHTPKKVPSAQRKRGVVESSYMITNTATCKAAGHVPLPGPPALVAKARQGGGHNIYSVANDMPSALLTTLARSAGVHIYCDGEDCGVLASGNAVWVHAIGPTDTTTRPGKRVITLPEPLLVTDEAGVEVCAEACATIL